VRGQLRVSGGIAAEDTDDQRGFAEERRPIHADVCRNSAVDLSGAFQPTKLIDADQLRELISTSFATVFRFLEVLSFAAGICSFDCPMPDG
jgi:hypothetical protein